ncbi:MAG: cardiolipin synthase [Planctomycetota bacterium]
MPWALLGLGVVVVAVTSAFHAILRTRTAQGAMAWLVALISMPLLAIPLYWLFGRRHFAGYTQAWRAHMHELRPLARAAQANLEAFHVPDDAKHPAYTGLQALAHGQVTRGNDVELLVNGEPTFASIVEGIAKARSYVLVEFYIVRDDGLGRRLRDALVERARAGVDVWFVYDELGSSSLSRQYRRSLEEAGVRIVEFGTTRGWTNRFQVNFRNHRKIVVVDGAVAWIGGHNVGDEYVGLHRKLTPWRDTHIRLEGPAVLEAQAAFLLDWCWATGELLDLSWEAVPSTTGDRQALVVATGPADDVETGKLLHAHLVNRAQHRLWIATPYFVPEPAVAAALQLAALRGVDVRVLVPLHNDSQLVRFASYWHVQELGGVGIRFLQYPRGFMHQKVVLVDEDLVSIGTHNFDNRSFLLNFEVAALVFDREVASRVEAMLERDMEHAVRLDPAAIAARPLWFRLATRAARLMAPVQ